MPLDVPRLLAQVEGTAPREPSIFEQLPGIESLLILAAAAVLIGLMYRFAKGSPAISNGFVVKVNGEDVSFSGQFPAQLQISVRNFLVNDVAAPTPYEVHGRWDDRILVVVVKGHDAKVIEQRIRNFMKLNIKRPK